MQPALDVLSGQIRELSYHDESIRELGREAKPLPHDAAFQELLATAGRAGLSVDPANVYSQEDYDAAGDQAADAFLQNAQDEQIKEKYLAVTGYTSTTHDSATMLAALSGSGDTGQKFRAAMAREAHEKRTATPGNEASITPGMLAEQILSSAKYNEDIAGSFRPGGSGTEEDLKFAQTAIHEILRAGNSDTAERLGSRLADQFGLVDAADGKADSAKATLNDLLKKDTFDDDSKAELRALLPPGASADAADRLETLFDGLHKASKIDPASYGLTVDPKTGQVSPPAAATNLGNISAQTATIQAGSVTVNQASGTNSAAAPPSAALPPPPPPPAPAAGTTAPDAAQQSPPPAAAPPSAALPPPPPPPAPAAGTTAPDAAQQSPPPAAAPPAAALTPPAAGTTAVDAASPPGTASAAATTRSDRHQEAYKTTLDHYGSQRTSISAHLAQMPEDFKTAIGMTTAGSPAAATQQISAVQNKAQGPVDITGTLSVVDLETAVFSATSRGGSVLNTPGGVPVMV